MNGATLEQLIQYERDCFLSLDIDPATLIQ